MIDLFKMLGTYFNTVYETPEKVVEIKEDISAQNLKIYNYFLLHKGIHFSASDLMKENILGVNTPITSYRRSINTLMNKNLIVRSGDKLSEYNRKEFTYQFNEHTN